MRRIVFESTAFEDFVDWSMRDKKLFRRLVRLLKKRSVRRFRESENLSLCAVTWLATGREESTMSTV